MTYPSKERETGSALLLSISLTLIVLGIITALVISSTTTSRAVTESSDQLAALYVAQSGLALAKQEIAETMDVDGDGLGTVAGNTLGGAYQVAATKLGDNLHQLDAVGTSRTGTANLREIVEVAAPSLKFPTAAMSILGGPGHDQAPDEEGLRTRARRWR